MKQRHTVPRQSQSSRHKKALSSKPDHDAEKTPIRCRAPLAIQSFEPDPAAVYSIEMAAQLAGMPKRAILVYCKHGLIAPTADPMLWGYWFDADAIRTLRRIEGLRMACGDDFPGIAMILNLMNEVQLLRAELRARIG